MQDDLIVHLTALHVYAFAILSATNVVLSSVHQHTLLIFWNVNNLVSNVSAKCKCVNNEVTLKLLLGSRWMLDRTRQCIAETTLSLLH